MSAPTMTAEVVAVRRTAFGEVTVTEKYDGVTHYVIDDDQP